MEKVKDREYFMHPALFYKNREINIHTASSVNTIDSIKKEIELDDAGNVPFDKLIIAAGAKNFIPPFPGSEIPGVVTLREKSDFDKFSSLLTVRNKVVVIGGGLLGLEIADIINKMGHTTTVLEVCQSVLPRQTDSGASEMLHGKITASGVSIRLHSIVSEIRGNGKVESVLLNTGEVIDAEIVVVSAGIVPNSLIAKFAEIRTGKAISVDDRMETSTPGIFAAGDCAEYQGLFDGIWETALEQGRVAGANAAGDDIRYVRKNFGVCLNAFGTKLFSIGDLVKSSASEYVPLVSKDETAGKYGAVYFKNGSVTGGVMLGDLSKTCELIAAVNNGWDENECRQNGICF